LQVSLEVVKTDISASNTIKQNKKNSKETKDKQSLSGIYKLKYKGCEKVLLVRLDVSLPQYI
jgi:hypothetical protein